MTALVSGELFANRYEIEQKTGAGGMGAVYRARDRFSGNLVALKVLQGRAGPSQEAERFVREAQILGQLNHPAVVAYSGHGQSIDGTLYLAMEWLEGEDLARRLVRGPLSISETVRLLDRVADALATAHQKGILHRDIKPSNLFLRHDSVEQVMLLDFGIARNLVSWEALTRTGLAIGTPGFMAPEQIRGSSEIGPATDLFSLGCVAYVCLTGRLPFAAEEPAAVLVKVLLDSPPPLSSLRPGIPAPLEAMIHRLLAKVPAERFQNAKAVQEALASIELDSGMVLSPAPVSKAGIAASFSERELFLFSIVLAALPDLQGDATMSTGLAEVELPRRQKALRGLRELGADGTFLPGGWLLVSLLSTASAADQAAIAARAALLIKEYWPQAQVAVCTGKGSAQGQTLAGDVVQRAAQLLRQPAAAAQANRGVLIDTLSADLLALRFVVTTTGQQSILLAEEREADASRPLLGKPTPCVGRETELGTMEVLLRGCIDESQARALLVTAAPGMGKSRLRHEFLRRVDKREESITVLLGRGERMSAGAPYEVLGQALRRLCGISGSESTAEKIATLRARLGKYVLPQDEERVSAFVGELAGIPFSDDDNPLLKNARRDPRLMQARIHRAFLDWLAAECAAAPVLFVLDDLHWGDALTVALLDEALRELGEMPLCLIALSRPEIRDVFPKLWAGHKLQEIEIKGLSKKASERLIQQVLGNQVTPGILGRIVEQAAGNALFLEELIRATAEGKEEHQAETVLAMLQARLGRFEAGLRRMVRAAAIFGQTFWRGGIAAVLGQPNSALALEAGLSKLIEAEVFEAHSSSRLANEKEYGFRHALMRDAAYSLLTESDMDTGHRLAGEFLEASGERDAAGIAEHYERGGSPELAVPLYQRAGDEAVRLYCYPKARQCYERACALFEKLPNSLAFHRLKIDLLLKFIQTNLTASSSDQNQEKLTTVRSLLDGLSQMGGDAHEDRLRMARADYYCGQIAYFGGQSREAIRHFKRVLSVAQQLGDRELLLIPSFAVGQALCMQGQMGQARDLLASVCKPLHEAGALSEWIRARGGLAMALAGTGDYPLACTEALNALEHARSINQPNILLLSLMVVSFVSWLGHDWPATIEHAKQAIAACQQAGELIYVFPMHGVQAWVKSFLQMPESADSDRAARLQLGQSLGGRLVVADWFDASDGEIELNAGRNKEALELAQAVSARSGATGELVMSYGIAERVWGSALSRLGGTAAECDAHFASSIAIFEKGNLVLQIALTRLLFSQALRARGEKAAAAVQLALATEQLQKSGCTYALTQASRLAGV